MEASLSGLLILAGVRAGYAVLATLVYRIASYWLPPLAGPSAYLLFRHRYGWPAPAAQRRERAASRRRAAKGAREAAACRNLPGLPGVVWAASRIRLGRTI